MRRISESEIDEARSRDLREVVERLFGDVPKKLTAKERAGACPRCGGVDRFRVNVGKNLGFCRVCGLKGDPISIVRGARQCEFVEAVELVLGRKAAAKVDPEEEERRRREREERQTVLEAQEARKRAKMRWGADQILCGSVAAGDPAAQPLWDHLARRGISRERVEPLAGVGWNPSVLFCEEGHPLAGQWLGAIIGRRRDPLTGEPTGSITRTFLAPDGSKVGPAMSLAGDAGVVMLDPFEAAGEYLVLAEGLETAAAGIEAGSRPGWRWGPTRPIWSTGTAGSMAKFPVVPRVKRLLILADNDENKVGLTAAWKVKRRWEAAGKQADILMPPRVGADFNDWLKEAVA